ncbi:MAG: chorismate mutase, partial [Acidisphaera sp.]|nr:chorismate mutase [Acidisphaera sp.]
MMPSTISAVHPSPDPAEQPLQELGLLRAELDRLDDALHDTLMQRAAVVERVAGTKDGIALRPGREAAILRRLLKRHSGPLPRQTIIRIWRELFAGTTAMQGRFTVTVCDTDPGNSYAGLAREHFGALTPLRVHRSPAQAIAEISAGTASAAVLPTPVEGEPSAIAWWTALLQRDEPRIYVVARLPFWTPRPEGAPRGQALVVSTVAPDPTERDRSLLGLEFAPEVSRARLIAALTSAGFLAGPIILRREPGPAAGHALVDVEGHVSDGDPRLAALASIV